MLSSIYLYEVSYWLRKPVTYIYFVAFFCFSFVSFIGSGGFFDPPVKATGAVRLLNSPHELNYLFQYLGKVLLFLVPAIVGTSIFKDFKHKVYPILYSFPINKRVYLTGKFLGAFTIVLCIALACASAFLVGEWLLGYSNPKIGALNYLGYLQAYLVFLIPNLFVIGIFVFAIVTISRNIYAGFLLVIFVFLFQLITENGFAGNDLLIAITDPFGQNAVGYETQFWTLAEQNTKIIPISAAVVYNRILWLALAMIVVIILFNVFTFSYGGFQLFRRNRTPDKSVTPASSTIQNIKSADVAFDFSTIQRVKLIWKLSKLDFMYLIANPMFYVFGILGVLSIVFMVLKVTNTGEMVMLPLTRIMLAIPSFFFVTITILLTFIYSGMLVHRSSLSDMKALIDATPVSNGVLLFSKIIAIVKVQYLLLWLLMITGITIQLSNGFFTLEIDQYLFHLLVIFGISLIAWAFASVFVHTLVPNVYLGIFMLLLLWLAKGSMSEIGITTYLLQFNTPPPLVYSDLNGYGNLFSGYFLVQVYWVVVSLFLILLSYLLWRRENFFSFKESLKIANFRLSGSLRIIGSTLFLCLMILGVSIYNAENSKDVLTITPGSLQNFESNFSQYKNLLQPRIKSIKMTMDMYPEKKSFTASGYYMLVNQTSAPMDTLLIKTGFDEHTSYAIPRANTLISSDKLMKFFVHKLKTPLQPGDTLSLSFKIENQSNTLFQRNSGVLENGTFLKHDILPRLGYFIGDEKKEPHDPTALNNHYQAIDSDLINFEAIISTTKSQTAIASGNLVNQWRKDNRNYAYFKTDKPVKMGMTFNSGKFEIQKDYWSGIPIEVYHHNTHTRNIARMIAGIKAALSYNSIHYTPYQHTAIKIIEFPLSEGSFATALGNAILTSEVRFGINAESEAKIDLPFYVSAHEMTHQWFGNQLLPKDVLGAPMLAESITEYISLKIYKQHFGKERALQFLKAQRLRYLKGRANETEKESPLYLVKAEQEYVSYGKGALAFNTIAHYLGENKMNSILKSFLSEYSSADKNYPTTIDFINELEQAVPEDLHYLISDFFKNIVFYDSRMGSASIQESDEGYNISLDFTVDKYNDMEPEKSLPLNDLIEIGFYNSNDSLFEVKQVHIQQVKNNITFHLNERPTKVVIDPNLLTIEKELENNKFSL